MTRRQSALPASRGSSLTATRARQCRTAGSSTTAKQNAWTATTDSFLLQTKSPARQARLITAKLTTKASTASALPARMGSSLSSKAIGDSAFLSPHQQTVSRPILNKLTNPRSSTATSALRGPPAHWPFSHSSSQTNTRMDRAQCAYLTRR